MPPTPSDQPKKLSVLQYILLALFWLVVAPAILVLVVVLIVGLSSLVVPLFQH